MRLTLRDLDSSEFTYELYKPELLSTLPVIHDNDLISLFKRIEEYAVGKCDGSLLEFRPRSDVTAVMFEYKGEKFWLHIEYFFKIESELSELLKQE